MNLNFEKIKRAQQEGHGNQWAPYSDLFMMLSTVFLLLFIVANMRTGSQSYSANQQIRGVQAENEDLKQQLKVYEVLKDDYQQKGASAEEVAIYQQVVGKLDLLEGEARTEREQLFKKAKAAQEKEQALNQYQQIVKNIVNANMLASSKLKRKDTIIEERVQEITEAEDQVTDLAKSVRKKEAVIAQNTAKIDQIETELDRRVKALRTAYKNHKTSRVKMQAEIARLQTESTTQINSLQSENQKVASQLKVARAEATQKTKQVESLTQTLSQKESEYQTTLLTLKQAKEQALAKAKNEFETKLAREQMSADARLREEQKYRAQVEGLNQTYNQKVQGLQTELSQAQSNVSNVKSQLAQTQGALAKKESEAQRLVGQLAEKENDAQRRISALQRAHEGNLARAQGDFESKLRGAQLTAQQKLDAERKHRGELEAMNAQFNSKLTGLNQELSATRGNLKGMEQKYAGALGSLTKLQNEKKLWANRIKDALAKNGIRADVDARTGEVMINFGDEYFDTGAANLKASMKSTLEKFFPIYSKSLLDDPKLANRLSSVELVGFASPTYRGKYVNPESLTAGDRAAVNFNMDLSYQRAKSIFEHVFDPNKMQFTHQKDLLPYVKVTGRSYLATEKQLGRQLTMSDGDNFCQKYDCKKAQKVIIKFNLTEE